MSRDRIRILYTRLRKEEKLLAEASQRSGVDFTLEDVRDWVMPQEICGNDIFLCRCIGHWQNLEVARILHHAGARTVNAPEIMEICGDKIATSSILKKAEIPQPGFLVAFSRDAALEAAGRLGYPVVFKPSVGSWGRLLAKVGDPDMAESIAEHKDHLGPAHQVFYIQEFIQKPGFDIRAFIVGGEPVCAIRRYSDHWITNTARGGKTEEHPLDKDLREILCRVHDVIPGDFLAVDCFLTDSGLLVNEVNDGAEFRNSIDPTGRDIAGDVIALCSSLLKRKNLKRKEKKYSGPGTSV